MRIVVTGATGLIGSSFVTDALNRGDEIVSLSRDIDRARKLLPVGVNHYQWDALHELPPLQAFQEADGVVNLLGEPIFGRWTSAKKLLIYQSRVQATHNLAERLASLNNQQFVLVSASALGYYGDRKDAALDENETPGSDFLSKVCVDWEEEASSASREHLDVSILRFANVLSSTGGMLPILRKIYRLGLGAKIGSGEQWVPWVHINDAVSALRFALANPKIGIINVVAPGILRQGQFSQALGKSLNRKILTRVPGYPLKVVFGEFSSEILGSKRMVPDALLSTGFKFEFDELDRALKDLFRA